MKSDNQNNIKLGFFVLLGFTVLIMALFYIGNGNAFFRSDIELKTRFKTINGLQEGNNVLFSGVHAGTVKSIVLVNGSSIEVTMLIKKNIIKYIPINSTVAITTDGLMGNKILNITAGASKDHMVQQGDYLKADHTADIDQILVTLSQSNQNINEISKLLKLMKARL
jgi:phospholipid/cholesterol/gamma-HCH transport system substrate-binding protein